MKLLIIMTLLVITNGCSNKSSPEELLIKFVTKRFAGESNKRGLLKYLSGVLYENIDEMDTKEFEGFTNFSNKKLSKVNIELKKCDLQCCNITYTIFYSVSEKGGVHHSVEVKKIAKIDLEENEWKIVSISNVKSFIEAHGINLPAN